MASNPTKSTVHIHENQDGDTPFVLHPVNDEILSRTGKQMIQGCQLSIGLDAWIYEVRAMFKRVEEWCQNHHKQVMACYSRTRGAKIVLFFVPALNKYDFALADELVDLSLELSTHYNVGLIELGQIPGNDLERFLDPQSAGVVYGQPRPTLPAVEA